MQKSKNDDEKIDAKWTIWYSKWFEPGENTW